MAVLKSKSCHSKSTKQIMNHLELDADSIYYPIAFDCINLGWPDSVKGQWAEMMDTTRMLMGNDTDWGSRKCVTYQHYKIYPDVNDNVELSAFREAVMKWCTHFFGDNLDPGKFGSYEVAIIYYNDTGKLHAHIIVNNSDLETGRRLQLSNKACRELSEYLQIVCKEFGLSYFNGDSKNSAQRKVGRYLTSIERKIRAEGKFPWKDSIANRVSVALCVSKNFDEFSNTCKDFGVEIRDSHSGFVFSLTDEKGTHCVSGIRLGKDYTKKNIQENIAGYSEWRKGCAVLRNRILRLFKLKDVSSSHSNDVEAFVDECAFALSFAASNNITTLSGFTTLQSLNSVNEDDDATPLCVKSFFVEHSLFDEKEVE